MSYKLNRGPKIVAAYLSAVALFAGARYATTHGLLTPPAAESKVPERASLPALNEAEAAPAGDLRVTLPGREPVRPGHRSAQTGGAPMGEQAPHRVIDVRWHRAEIVDRLDALRRMDPDNSRFGAAAHRYELNQPLAEPQVAAFEAQHGVTLPQAYRTFLLDVGDGGAGPFYGIFRLDRSDLPDRDDEDRLPGFLAGEFLHTRHGTSSTTVALLLKRSTSIQPEFAGR
jgi:hypothetical protein